MNKNGVSLRVLLVGVLALLLSVAACTGPAESDLHVSAAWARAAAAGTMDMMDMDTNEASDSGEMETEAEDQAAESDDMAMADGDGDSMVMHSGNVSAAYMVIENKGGAADRLLGATTDAAAVVEIHTVEVENEVARMMPLPDGLETPANDTIALEPGGYHIMLIDLQTDLVAGETIALTLNFESGKTIAVEAEIREP